MLSEPGLLLAIGLALVHAFLSEWNLFSFLPEHRWISFSGGVSIGYIFLEVFPELSHAQLEVEHSRIPLVIYLESHVYLIALFGLLVFYGLDILALSSRRQNWESSQIDCTSPEIFWIHVTGFACLNIVFGYLIQDIREHSWLDCALFFTTVSLHFFIIDRHLRHHHKVLYDQVGRWVLTAAILVGAIVGQALHLEEAIVAAVWSFLAGSLILNILGHELPDEHRSCFWSFLAGTVLYSGLILAT